MNPMKYMKHMKLVKQCQKWHEENEYQKIIDALESIPAEERSPEMDSELACAYNNLAGLEDRESYQKALALLKPHADYFAGEHHWNFRMGYSYYHLNQEGRALPYFRKALESLPDDKDTQEFICACNDLISLPQFEACFRQRTVSAWESFADQELKLRKIIDENKNNELGDELLEQCYAILNIAFDNIAFEMGFNGEKYELILTPEGDKVKLFELVYFQKHAPKKVLEHWNIILCHQPIQNIGLRTDDDWEISADDVQVWLEEREENTFALFVYCEKLLPMLREEEGQVWWMLTTIIDQTLGEISHMRYIDSFDVLDVPKEDSPTLLSQLPEKLKARGLDMSGNPEGYLDSYIGYEMEPDETIGADLRLDTIAGSTCCLALLNGYLNADNDFVDDLHADGTVAGFFCYPLDTLREEEGSQKIFDFRDELEKALTIGDGSEALTLTGGATGLYYGYIDFIAWDLRTTLKMAKEFFEASNIPWASFRTFRREANTVQLKDTRN